MLFKQGGWNLPTLPVIFFDNTGMGLVLSLSHNTPLLTLYIYYIYVVLRYLFMYLKKVFIYLPFM